MWKHSVFDPPQWMVLAIQSALYKIHKHHNDQKTACCQPLLLLDASRGDFLLMMKFSELFD